MVNTYVGDEYGSTVTASAADTTALAAQTGVTFHLRNLVVDNTDAAACEYALYDGTVAAGTLKIRLQLAANESVVLTDLSGIRFTSDLHHVGSVSAVVAIGGIKR